MLISTTARQLIAESLSEMQDYFEVRSENWHESRRGDDYQEKITSMEAVLVA